MKEKETRRESKKEIIKEKDGHEIKRETVKKTSYTPEEAPKRESVQVQQEPPYQPPREEKEVHHFWEKKEKYVPMIATGLLGLAIIGIAANFYLNLTMPGRIQKRLQGGLENQITQPEQTSQGPYKVEIGGKSYQLFLKEEDQKNKLILKTPDGKEEYLFKAEEGDKKILGEIDGQYRIIIEKKRPLLKDP